MSHYSFCQGLSQLGASSTCSWLGWAVSCGCRVGAAAGKLCAVCLLWCTIGAGVAGAETVCQTHIKHIKRDRNYWIPVLGTCLYIFFTESRLTCAVCQSRGKNTSAKGKLWRSCFIGHIAQIVPAHYLIHYLVLLLCYNTTYLRQTPKFKPLFAIRREPETEKPKE